MGSIANALTESIGWHTYNKILASESKLSPLTSLVFFSAKPGIANANKTNMIKQTFVIICSIAASRKVPIVYYTRIAGERQAYKRKREKVPRNFLAKKEKNGIEKIYFRIMKVYGGNKIYESNGYR